MPDEASGGAAAASAWLVDTLAAMLHQRALLAHPEGQSAPLSLGLSSLHRCSFPRQTAKDHGSNSFT